MLHKKIVPLLMDKNHNTCPNRGNTLYINSIYIGSQENLLIIPRIKRYKTKKPEYICLTCDYYESMEK